MGLSLSRHRRDGTVTVTARGEVDLLSAVDLEREITVPADDAATIVVDLSGVTFLDSAGISTLLKGRRVADSRGQQYRVADADAHTRRVLDIAGVWTHLSGEKA